MIEVTVITEGSCLSCGNSTYRENERKIEALTRIAIGDQHSKHYYNLCMYCLEELKKKLFHSS